MEPMIYQIEEDEGFIRLSIGGVEVCRHSHETREGMALLHWDANRRAMIERVTGVISYRAALGSEAEPKL